jgi:DNA-binding PadR family transcriptional regulator
MCVDILILESLATRPQHGYEIKKGVERILGSDFSINNNLLYPALRRFEELGAVSREVVRTPGRPDRHVYHLTDRGVELLQHMLSEFPPNLAEDQAEFQVRVAFLDLLEPAARLDILAAREAVVRKRLAHLERMSEVEAQDAPRHPYAARLIAFNESQARHELEWIAALMQEVQEEIP